MRYYPNLQAVVAMCILLILSLILVLTVLPVNAQTVSTGNDDHKIDICHVPPGSPENAHTISVDKHAWENGHTPHNKHSDDYVGECRTPDPTPAPPSPTPVEPTPTDVRPTDTPVPTNTPVVTTVVPTSSPTNTPTQHNTPVPTKTLAPTDEPKTPVPTNTPKRPSQTPTSVWTATPISTLCTHPYVCFDGTKPFRSETPCEIPTPTPTAVCVLPTATPTPIVCSNTYEGLSPLTFYDGGYAAGHADATQAQQDNYYIKLAFMGGIAVVGMGIGYLLGKPH
jgi:hypothetical protein